MILQVLNPANYGLNGYAMPMLVVGVAIVLLGLFVLVREHGSLIGILFLLMGLSASLYLSATGVNYASHNDGLSLLWIRISQLGSVFIPTTVLLFTVARLGLFHRFRFTLAASIVLSTLLAFGVIFTDLHVRGSARFFWGNFVQYGLLGFVFMGFFFFIMVLTLRLYWQEYRLSTNELHKKRFRGLLIAFSIAYVGAVDFLPALGVPVYPFGYVPLFIFVVISAYVVIQYRLVDITPELVADQILETMEGAVIVIDLEGKIRLINRAALEMLGNKKSDLLNEELTSIIRIPDGSSAAVRAEERSLAREMVWPGRNGKRFDVIVSASAVTDERSVPIGTVYVAHDITVRKQAEEALQISEEKFRSIFEQATYGILIADAETKNFIEANKAMCIMLGYTRDEIVGLSIDDIHPKEELPAISESFQKQVRGEITRAPKVPMLRKDGSLFYADINSTSVTLGGKQYVLGIFRDITDQQKLEEQLRQAQKMESIGTLAGGIAHDFNNILSVIIGYGNIALMKMAKDDPQRENIEQILEAGERAARLTQSLLLFSRKQISERKPVDLNEIIRTVDKFLKRVIGEDVECRTVLFESALPIFGDAHQLEQVLMNLATNARDAMATGDTFTIATEEARLDEVFISIHGYGKPGIYGLITVSDTGKGMDTVTREHIFEPFFTTKGVGKGTGLGLAIVYGIVKQHEGFINVYSELGQGTTFKIYLPLISADVKEEHKPVKERPRGGTETILLAEDDKTVRIMTTAILESAGYTVIAAVDGQDVVNKFMENKDRIELLLFDIIMPKKSGKEAYDEIREIQPDIKILFQSGYAPDLIRQRLLLEGKMPVVFKPITPTELLKQVRSVLDHVT